MMWYGWDSGFCGGFGWIGMLLWWGLIIAGIVWFVRWVIGQTDASRHASALDILKERYAKGEVSAHEYEKMKKELES